MSRHRHARTRPGSHIARYVAAASSIGAAQIHVVMAPVHAGEWPVSGVFFALLGVFQALWGLAVLRWSGTPLLAVGATVNLGALGLWVLSRLQGMPLGPHAGVPEAVGASGLITAALEAVLVLAALGALLWRAARPEPGTAAIGVAAVSAIAVVFATAAAVSEADSHGHGDMEPGQPGTSPSADSEPSAEEPTSGHSEGSPTEDGHHDDGHEH